jgi:hypothetical protein
VSLMEEKLELDELPPELREPLVPFVQACIDDGIGKTEGSRRVAAGEWVAYRDGSRKLLITTRSILARRKRFLKKIKGGERRGLYRQPPFLRREEKRA